MKNKSSKIKSSIFKTAFFALILSLLSTGILWMVGYDSACGFSANCNRGINPTTMYGLRSLPLRTQGLYSGSEILYNNLLLTLAIFFLIYMVVMYLIFRFRK